MHTDGTRLLEEFLPELRRHAFLATGSRAAGDGLIEACLDAAGARDVAPDEDRPRRSVYRLFHATNPEIRVVQDPHETGWQQEDRLRHHLLALPPFTRAAVLLHVPAGFSLEDTAHILRAPLHEVRRVIGAARHRLLEIARARVLIIEDNFLIADELARAVEEATGRAALGAARSSEEAIRLATLDQPSLVLADLDLPDGPTAGLDAAQAIAAQHKASVLYVTGYPERLPAADDRPPTHVAKPFTGSAVRHAITKALLAVPNAVSGPFRPSTA